MAGISDLSRPVSEWAQRETARGVWEIITPEQALTASTSGFLVVGQASPQGTAQVFDWTGGYSAIAVEVYDITGNAGGASNFRLEIIEYTDAAGTDVLSATSLNEMQTGLVANPTGAYADRWLRVIVGGVVATAAAAESGQLRAYANVCRPPPMYGALRLTDSASGSSLVSAAKWRVRGFRA